VRRRAAGWALENLTAMKIWTKIVAVNGGGSSQTASRPDMLTCCWQVLKNGTMTGTSSGRHVAMNPVTRPAPHSRAIQRRLRTDRGAG